MEDLLKKFEEDVSIVADTAVWLVVLLQQAQKNLAGWDFSEGNLRTVEANFVAGDEAYTRLVSHMITMRQRPDLASALEMAEIKSRKAREAFAAALRAKEAFEFLTYIDKHLVLTTAFDEWINA